MYAESLSKARRVVAVVLLAMVAGCSDSSPTDANAGEIPNFEGTYLVSGTYDGRTGDSGPDGSLTVSSQADSVATVAVELKMKDNGNVFFALNVSDPDVSAASDPVQALLKSDGSLDVTFTGDEEITGIDPTSCCSFTLHLTGMLNGNTITGRWGLTTDMPSSDAGSFTAGR